MTLKMQGISLLKHSSVSHGADGLRNHFASIIDIIRKCWHAKSHSAAVLYDIDSFGALYCREIESKSCIATMNRPSLRLDEIF